MSVETLENSHTQKNIHIHQPSQEDQISSVADFEIFRRLSAAKGIGNFMRCIAEIIEDLGFEDYAFARVDAPGSVELPIVTSPTEMRNLYMAEKLYDRDLMVDYITHNTRAIFQSELVHHNENTPFITDTVLVNQSITKLLKSYGYFDFYIIPCRAHNGSGQVVLSITARNANPDIFRRLIASKKTILYQIAEAIDFIGTRYFPEFFLANGECRDIVITPRPLELLTVLAQEDMSLNEAAEFLNRSIYTVNQQIAVARKAFGADTNHGAVYQAVREGLIDCKR